MTSEGGDGPTTSEDQQPDCAEPGEVPSKLRGRPPARLPAPRDEHKKESDEKDYDATLAQLRTGPDTTEESRAGTTARLGLYRRLEELSWEADANVWQMRNLAWALRSKRAESRLLSIDAQDQATDVAATARRYVLIAVSMLLVGWATFYVLVAFLDRHLDWTMLVATSGAVLLLLGCATLLFRVARDHDRRGRRYAEDVEYTRRLEVAVRVALACGDTDKEPVSKALAALAVQLAAPPPKAPPDEVEQLHAIPEVLSEASAIVAKAVGKAKGD